MKNNQKEGFSFNDERLNFRGAFHVNKIPTQIKKKEEGVKNQLFARFQKSLERKISRARRRLLGDPDQDQIQISANIDKHEYDYKQFADQPTIQFSSISLLILAPILLCVNVSIAQRQKIPMVQFLFIGFFVSFIFNLVFILRRNRLMPFLPTNQADNKLKIASAISVIALFFSLKYGWSASGGMLFAIFWQSLAGRQGCMYLIIFGFIVGGSLTMQLNNPQDYLMKLISSILFGISQTLLHTLSKNSPYAIANQLSLFLMVGTVSFFTVMDIVNISMWQYVILIVLGFSCYFNLLLIIKLMQSERVSMVMGVMSGIIIISATDFNSINDYVACLTIVLSILVLLKIEYLDSQ